MVDLDNANNKFTWEEVFMPELGASPAAQPKHPETSDRPELKKMVELVQTRNMVAANIPQHRTTSSVAEDVEDMWDNLPV